MFQEEEGKWRQVQGEFTENVTDAIGASIYEELFQEGKQNIAALQRQYQKSEEDKHRINTKLAELRSIT